jgi:transposase
LKQFLISLLCIYRTVPVFGRSEDGNGSDKLINNAILTNISKYISQHGIKPGAFIYIADSSMVTAGNLAAMDDQILFISRLPATYKACSEAIKTAIDANKWQRLGEFVNTQPTANQPAAVYKSFETEVVIKDKTYRAVVIHSRAHDKRRQKRIDRQLAQERKVLEKHCKEVG